MILEMLVKALLLKLILASMGMGGAPWGGGTGAEGMLTIGGVRQKGGPVRPDQPYMVGERGPELFVPKTSGEVIPHGQFQPMQFGGFLKKGMQSLVGEGGPELFAPSMLGVGMPRSGFWLGRRKRSRRVLCSKSRGMLAGAPLGGGDMFPTQAIGLPAVRGCAAASQGLMPRGLFEKFKMFQHGGPARRGEPVMVGERGPRAVHPGHQRRGPEQPGHHADAGQRHHVARPRRRPGGAAAHRGQRAKQCPQHRGARRGEPGPARRGRAHRRAGG